MNTIFSLIYILILSTVSYGQQIEYLKKSLDSLSDLKKSYQQKIMELDKEYSRINIIYNSKQIEHKDSGTFIVIHKTKIYKAPDELVGISEMEVDEKVKVLGQQTNSYGSFYKVSYYQVVGWVFKESLISFADYQRKLKIVQLRKNEERKAYKDDLIKKYGATDAQRILEHKFWIGMTDKMARESLGSPKDINRTVSSWGVNEQWIYGNTYLYFENGVLTSYQN